MAYSEKHNLIFLHIPKNAGTSIIETLGMSHGHTDLENMNSLKEKHPTAKTFVVVRNPWDRVVSVYKYLRMKKSFWHSRDGCTKFGITPDHIKAQKCKDFKEFVHKIKNKDFKQAVHLRPQTCWIPKNILVDHVLYYEQNLNEQFKIKLNVDIELKILNVSDKDNNKTYRDYYDEETKQIISDVYKSDIIQLGYAF